VGGAAPFDFAQCTPFQSCGWRNFKTVGVSACEWSLLNDAILRDLLPFVIALGPIDQTVRREIGRASHPRASPGKCPESVRTLWAKPGVGHSCPTNI